MQKVRTFEGFYTLTDPIGYHIGYPVGNRSIDLNLNKFKNFNFTENDFRFLQKVRTFEGFYTLTDPIGYHIGNPI